MEIFYGTVAFVLGLVVGSFLNVCIYRLPTGESVAAGRSHCMSCGHTLAWYDLFPVASWLFLGGKCRYCKAPISPRYAAVEVGNALLWLMAYRHFGPTPMLAVALCAISCLLVAALIDWDTGLIYDRFCVIIAALGVLAAFFDPGVPIPDRLIGAVCVSLPMLALALLTGGFGGGDIKLVAACGLLLGWKNALVAAFIAVTAGGLYACLLLLLKKAGKRSEIPFGPFIAAGEAAALLWGGDIIGWYLALYNI